MPRRGLCGPRGVLPVEFPPLTKHSRFGPRGREPLTQALACLFTGARGYRFYVQETIFVPLAGHLFLQQVATWTTTRREAALALAPDVPVSVGGSGRGQPRSLVWRRRGASARLLQVRSSQMYGSTTSARHQLTTHRTLTTPNATTTCASAFGNVAKGERTNASMLPVAIPVRGLLAASPAARPLGI